MKSTAVNLQNTDSARRRELSLLGCLLAAMVVFLLMLGRRDIVTSHEARVAQTARQMAVSGWPWSAIKVEVPLTGLIDTPNGKRLAALTGRGTNAVNPWLVPVINGQVRLQKPPLPYWCTAVSYRLFAISETTARLSGALFGALATLLIWDLAKMVLGRRAALPAALVWMTTQFVVDEFRKSMADPYLAFFTLLAVWAWIRGGSAGTIVFYVAAALGMLAKGPPIFVSLVPAMIFALVLPARSRRAGIAMHLFGLLIFFAIALPWYVYVIRNVPHAIELWRYESIGEFGENVEKSRPWWLYVANSFQLALPWTPIWIFGIAAHFARGRQKMWTRRARRRWFALGWFVLAVMIFSFSNVKKNAYLLPLMPAQTLIIADAIVLLFAIARQRHQSPLQPLVPVFMWMQVALGIGFAGGLLVVLWHVRDKGVTVTDLSVATATLLIALFSAPLIARKRLRGWLLLQSAAYLLLLITQICIYSRVIDNQRSPRAFAKSVSEYMQESGEPLLVQQLPEEASFYMPLRLNDGADAPRVLILVDHNLKDPPVNSKLLSTLLNGASVRGFQRVKLNADDGHGRWQLFDVIVDRSPAVARAS